MSPRLRSTLAKGVAAVAATASLAGVAVAATTGAPDPPPPAVPQDHGAAPMIDAADTAQLSLLGVLRRAAQPDDAAPDAVRAHVGDGAAPDLGANVALARHALTTALGEGLYVVPARGWVCLESTTGGGTCTPTDRIADGYAVGLEAIPSGFRIGGLVPDGVARVEVLGAGGTTAEADVTGNAWRADVPFAPSSVAWAGDAGEKAVPIIPPPDAPTAGPVPAVAGAGG
jgi:hypothetical protein